MFLYQVTKAKEGTCGLCRKKSAVVKIEYGTRFGNNQSTEIHQYCQGCASMLSDSITNLITFEEEDKREWK